MNVEIRFFASVRELMARESLSLELPCSATKKMLLDRLAVVLGACRFQQLIDANVSIALNHELTDTSFTLQHGDEVAFLPPITGG